jgi:transposase
MSSNCAFNSLSNRFHFASIRSTFTLLSEQSTGVTNADDQSPETERSTRLSHAEKMNEKRNLFPKREKSAQNCRLLQNSTNLEQNNDTARIIFQIDPRTIQLDLTGAR